MATAGDRDTLRLADTFRNLFYTPVYVAVGGGFLHRQGLDIHFSTVPSGVDSISLLKDGTAVAAFLGGAVPHPAITQASATLDVQFLPYAETAREELTEAYAFFWPVNVPAGTYKSQDADFPGMNVGSMHLITSGDQDEELVYEVTKTIWENRAAVVQRTATGRAINEGNVARNTGTDFHPGAIRFYQEIGIWP